jgi:hypothetical protein
VPAAGGATVEKRGLLHSLRRPVEVIVRMAYGALTGGSMVRKYDIMAAQFPDSSAAANDLVRRAMFDPDIAKHLLVKPVSEVGTPSWNKKLNRLMGWAVAGREIGNSNSEE